MTKSVVSRPLSVAKEALSIGHSVSWQLTASSRQNSEVRDEISEVRGNLMSDILLLTSVIGDLNDFIGFNDLNGLNVLSNRLRTTDNGPS